MSKEDEPWPGFETLTEVEVQRELAKRTKAWSDGDYAELGATISFCSRHNLPLPKWATDGALDAMFFAYVKGYGAPGKGKTGSIQKQTKRRRIDSERCRVAASLLAERVRGATREDAFNMAHEKLVGTDARGSAAAIEASYNRHLRRLRNKS